nr:lasso peptide biosynthesis B2 protein [Halochromatium glycolicum]
MATAVGAAPAVTTVPSDTSLPTDTIQALSVAVEAMAASTRPRYWPLKRACLYYALAGQVLLAEQGISAQLRVGRVVYHPGTARAHAIAPHVWLETATHFIDYATLPRWGQVTIIPRDRVAVVPAEVVPGGSRVLAARAEVDDGLRLYLNHHNRQFQGRLRGLERRCGGRRWPPYSPAGSTCAMAALPNRIGLVGSVGARWRNSPCGGFDRDQPLQMSGDHPSEHHSDLNQRRRPYHGIQ